MHFLERRFRKGFRKKISILGIGDYLLSFPACPLRL